MGFIHLIKCNESFFSIAFSLIFRSCVAAPIFVAASATAELARAEAKAFVVTMKE